ncbi:hypothetical protein [Sporichthya sp.]|uniref:hypothetical protein n=1 Tax=Sporichthya sp. TaxID=65475 RepID=UPI0017B2DC98|nr:hypothetical protein [Sporichthya sp.]MBA3742252.1 hypothetical protein [Sporichthya sp.]
MTAAPETGISEQLPPPDPEQPELTDYASFGARFFDVLVTADRVAAAVNGALGDEQFGIGPVPVGPGKLARLTVTGELGKVTARRRGKEPLRFRLTIPADINLLIEMAGQDNRFHGSVLVGLDVTARAALPLALVFEIAPPAPEDIKVVLAADGLRANLLRTLAAMDEEVHRYVLRYVTRELESDRVREACRIDIASAVQGAWSARYGSRRPRD